MAEAGVHDPGMPAEPAQPATAGRTADAVVDPQTLREAVWARVQLARKVHRPHTLELVGAMATDVIELHGDRLFGDDAAIVGGFCRIDGRRVVFVGHQKGAETNENIRRNFGMPHPEGYRKAMRLFRLAERLHLPVVTFVDTPGAFPGPAAEERGVAEAIARSIQAMTGLRTPIVTVITGEGGSGGALAIAVGDVVLALENAIYSVISPEGCASILWRSPDRAQEAAVAMRLTAREQETLGVVDEVIPEPDGGAHEDTAETARRLRARIVHHLDTLAGRDRSALVDARYARYRRMGEFATIVPSAGGRPERVGLADRIRALLESGRAALPGGDGAPLRPSMADAEEEPPLREEI
ncbi:MAG: acetyl-CoA carboxylase carboxyltransferase subunit alpha [Chloroflexota bacterium]|nr:acetyl-CoA carboxylase carboxyltransferase subunit alpha [Chloroflexota bacterium]